MSWNGNVTNRRVTHPGLVARIDPRLGRLWISGGVTTFKVMREGGNYLFGNNNISAARSETPARAPRQRNLNYLGGASISYQFPTAAETNFSRWSFMMWFMCTTLPGAGAYEALIVQTNNANGLFVGLGGTSGKLEFWTGAGTINGTNGATTILANKWYHVAGTWDGTNRTLYINGVQDLSAAASFAVDATHNLGVACDTININRALLGGWAEFSYYNRALTIEEIRASYYQEFTPEEDELSLSEIVLTTASAFQTSATLASTANIIAGAGVFKPMLATLPSAGNLIASAYRALAPGLATLSGTASIIASVTFQVFGSFPALHGEINLIAAAGWLALVEPARLGGVGCFFSAQPLLVDNLDRIQLPGASGSPGANGLLELGYGDQGLIPPGIKRRFKRATPKPPTAPTSAVPIQPAPPRPFVIGRQPIGTYQKPRTEAASATQLPVYDNGPEAQDSLKPAIAPSARAHQPHDFAPPPAPQDRPAQEQPMTFQRDPKTGLITGVTIGQAPQSHDEWDDIESMRARGLLV